VKNRDAYKKFTDRFQDRPASFSFFSSWEWSKDEWYDNYILGLPKEENQAMAFGTLVGDSIGTENNLVPQMDLPGIKEYEMRADLDDIKLVGYADFYCPDTKILNENKTTTNTKKWNQQSVDEHKQFEMYALLLLLQDKVKPEEVTMFLNYIPVEIKGVTYKMPKEPTFIQIPTSRTSLQVAKYALYIKQTVEDMEAYVKTRL
jgi:hypothetical protein